PRAQRGWNPLKHESPTLRGCPDGNVWAYVNRSITIRGRRSPAPWAVQLCNSRCAGTRAYSAPRRRRDTFPENGDQYSLGCGQIPDAAFRTTPVRNPGRNVVRE